MVDLWRDFWIRETGTGQQVTQLHERYMMMMMMMNIETLPSLIWKTNMIIKDGWYIYNTGLFISPWNMLENWLMPQLNEDSNDYSFKKDGSPAHYKDVRGYLNRNLPRRWIGRTGKEDDALMRWPPLSPDLTPCNFFFWGFVKDTVFLPPPPR